MSEIHFRSHFWPFQIDTQLKFFWKFLIKWLPSAILDVRNSLSIKFLAILDQYEKINLFNFTKWPPALILDVRNSLSGHFRSICNFNLFWNFWYNGCRRTILDVRNSLSIEFLAISDRYATLFCLEFFDKMAAVGHFGCPRLAFDHIFGHFRSLRNYKMATADILDVRKSLSIAILAISYHFTSL